jgi:hypothetical protein
MEKEAGDPATVAANLEEAKEWEEELERLNALMPLEIEKQALQTTEIPALEARISKAKEKIPGLVQSIETVPCIEVSNYLSSDNKLGEERIGNSLYTSLRAQVFRRERH